MRIVLSGGGTAGHVYPALAVADRLRADGHDVTYYGTPAGLESNLVPAAGIEFRSLKAAGFDRSRPWTLLSSSIAIARSAVVAFRQFGDRRPDVVVGFGGYVSIPVGLAAIWRGIPLVLHEQNAVPGLTNRYLASRATTLCVTYPEAARVAHAGVRVVLTGNPVRESVLAASRERGRTQLGLTDSSDVLLLVFGGSRGARHLNERLVGLADAIVGARQGHVHVVHATGAAEYDAVLSLLGEQAGDSERYRVVPYIDNMGDVMAAADLAVCRAGATTIAELTAIGLGAILVPYPYATDDHQTKNAAAMVGAGAAYMFADADIDGSAFEDVVVRLLGDSEARDRMSRASRELGRPGAAATLAAEIYRAAGLDEPNDTVDQP